MDKVKVLVSGSTPVQELQPLPVKAAPTKVRSLEVHLSGFGKVVVVCENVVETIEISGKKIVIKILIPFKNSWRFKKWQKDKMTRGHL
jgi:hypothetical protein